MQSRISCDLLAPWILYHCLRLWQVEAWIGLEDDGEVDADVQACLRSSNTETFIKTPGKTFISFSSLSVPALQIPIRVLPAQRTRHSSTATLQHAQHTQYMFFKPFNWLQCPWLFPQQHLALLHLSLPGRHARVQAGPC